METFITKYGTVTLFKNDIYLIREFKQGSYCDISTLTKLKDYIDPNRNILEIGGHCGSSSIIYSSYLNEGNQLHVFEPQHKMYNLLVHNIGQNNLENKIIPYNNAVFCQQMSIRMNNIDLDGGGKVVSECYNNSNMQCNFGGIGLGTNGEIVESITVDSLIDTVTNIGFIHCDAQGAENHIFSEAKNFVRINRPVILYENNAKYGKYLYNNVCNSYPQFNVNSRFDLESYCMNELNYSEVIHRFNGSGDDLLIP